MHFWDPRALAASLAASVEAKTGRTLAFSAIDLQLLPRPALVVSQLRLGNAAWATQPWLATVERVSVEPDLPALLAGRLRARRIALSGVQTWLETDADGVGNWVVGSAQDGAPEWLKAVEIDTIAAQSIAIDYRHGGSDQTTALRIDRARIDDALAARPLRLSAMATIAGQRVEASATLGSLATLVGNPPDYPIDLSCRCGGARLEARGRVAEPLGAGVLDLALNAEAPEVAELAALFGTGLPPLGALRGTAQLTGTASAPALARIDATLGEPATRRLTLSGTVADLRAARGIDLRLRVQTTGAALPGLPPGLPPLRIDTRLRDDAAGYRLEDLELDVADSHVSAALQLARVDQRLRVSGRLSSPLIDLARWTPPAAGEPRAPTSEAPAANGIDVDLDVKIDRLLLPGGRQLQAGSGRLTLARGKLTAKALQATIGGAQVSVDGSLADPQRLAGIDLDVSLRGSELRELIKFFGHEVGALGAYQGHAHLDGSRAALRASAVKFAAGRAGQQLQVSGEVADVLARRGIALAVSATISDSEAAGRLFGTRLPRLPVIHAAARLRDVADGYAADEIKLTLGRSALQGSAMFAGGEPRPRLSATLSSPLIDLAELLPASAQRPATQPGQTSDGIDIDATLQIDRVQLPNHRSLGPLRGAARLLAGALELKRFAVAVDGAQATLDGRIGDPLALRAIDLQIDAQLTHSAGLAALTATRLGALPAFKLSGRLTDPADGYRIADLELKLPATTIAGEVTVARGKARPRIEVKASSPLLDLGAPASAASATKSGKTAATGKRLIPPMALPLDHLKRVDGSVDLRFDAVKLGGGAPLGPLSLRARLADGRLDAGPLQLAKSAEQTLNASATIDAGSAAWAARLDATQVDLERALARAGYPGLVSGGRGDLALQLRAHGQSLAALVASLDGELRFKVGALRAHNVAANLGEGLLTRTLALINPFLRSDPDTDVKCIAAKLAVKQGVLTSARHFAVETARYNAVLGGTLDLRSERLDLAVQPIIKGGRGIGAGELASIVRLRGTLAEPEVGIDAGGLAKSAVSIGAAVATLGGWWVADAVRKQIMADARHQRDFSVAATTLCDAARRVLLGDGYLVSRAENLSLVGAKEFQIEEQQHAILSVHANCEQRVGGSTLYVTATEDHYDVKAIRQSSSIGFPMVAPIYYGTQSEANGQVKTHGETVGERGFYERFYRAVQRQLVATP